MIVLFGLLDQMVEALPTGDHGQGTNNLPTGDQDQSNCTHRYIIHKREECKSNPKFNPRNQRRSGICHALIDDKGICGRYSWIVDGRCKELQRVKCSECDCVQCPLIGKLYPFRCQYWVAAIQNADGDPASVVEMYLHKYQGVNGQHSTQYQCQRGHPSQSTSVTELRHMIAAAPIQSILNPSDWWKATLIAVSAARWLVLRRRFQRCVSRRHQLVDAIHALAGATPANATGVGRAMI